MNEPEKHISDLRSLVDDFLKTAVSIDDTSDPNQVAISYSQTLPDTIPLLIGDAIQLLEQGVAVAGCTANLTWDDTLESIENFEAVKSIVRDSSPCLLLRSATDLDRDVKRFTGGVSFVRAVSASVYPAAAVSLGSSLFSAQ